MSTKTGELHSGDTDVAHLTQIFSAPVRDVYSRDQWRRNVAHLFDEELNTAAVEYGPQIVRRDLLDAMELACFVSSLDPPPPEAVTDEDRPEISSIDDVREVEMFAERVAATFDAMSRVQIVRDVPQDVVDRLTTENVGNIESEGTSTTDRVTGAYGGMLNELRSELRTIGESPADIAAIVRNIGTSVGVMRENKAIFDRAIAQSILRMIVHVLHSAIACVSTVMGASDSNGMGKRAS